MSAPPKNVARKLFRFGSRNKKFSRHNEKLLVPVFQKTRTTIGAFSVRILYLAPFLFSVRFSQNSSERWMLYIRFPRK
ncbi:hypothetical protein CLI72_08850 [Porphyromonas gingivalis]|nr:hypothetical protein [Porphyromonas gingivalis]PDP80515.1 hypothetical protein CLI72_08850 [Porphyromonas gingivalis]